MKRFPVWLSGWQKAGLRTPAVPVVVGLVVLAALVGLAGALTGLIGLFAAGVLVGLVVDQLAERNELVKLLFDRSHVGLVTRAMLREFAFVVLLVRLGWPDPDVLAAAAATIAVALARIAAVAIDQHGVALQAPPIATVNLGLDRLQAAGLRTLGVPWIVAITSVPLVAGTAGCLAGSVWPYLVSAAAAAVLAAGWTLWGLAGLVLHRRANDPGTLLRAAAAEVARLRPEVVLYFSGTPQSVYQVNTWLAVMERLDRKVLVVLRERVNLPLLGRTSLPVICIPGASDLMDFRLPTVRVAFFVAHVGKNIHLMREPRMKHVFIGHGESDKVASVNPVTKGFDEIWVAGRVSRQRWAAAKVGVRDDAIVEVGRPQLGGIELAAPRAGRPVSVLYAPTWEGWTSDPFNTSVTTMGPGLVGWLLDRPDTRVIYKPHPLTGTVSAAARRAHGEILALLARHPRTAGLPPAGDAGGRWGAVADRHLVVTGPGPDLYECFNNSDLLIADISSVVADYVASGKPYVIPNPAGRDHAAIREEYASARAAYLLDPAPAGWAGLFDTAVDTDPLRETRAQLRLDLLGPHYPDPVQPWREALTSLIERANAEWPDAERESLLVADVE